MSEFRDPLIRKKLFENRLVLCGGHAYIFYRLGCQMITNLAGVDLINIVT